MKSQLVRCSTCKRHIYASEKACPFCARQANTSPAVLAAALTAGLAIAGCGAETTQSMPPVEMAPQPGQPKEIAEDPKQDPPPNGTPAPVYGAPPPMDPGPVPPAAAYGAPPPMTPTPRLPPR